MATVFQGGQEMSVILNDPLLEFKMEEGCYLSENTFGLCCE